MRTKMFFSIISILFICSSAMASEEFKFQDLISKFTCKNQESPGSTECPNKLDSDKEEKIESIIVDKNYTLFFARDDASAGMCGNGCSYVFLVEKNNDLYNIGSICNWDFNEKKHIFTSSFKDCGVAGDITTETYRINFKKHSLDEINSHREPCCEEEK